MILEINLKSIFCLFHVHVVENNITFGTRPWPYFHGQLNSLDLHKVFMRPNLQ